MANRKALIAAIAVIAAMIPIDFPAAQSDSPASPSIAAVSPLPAKPLTINAGERLLLQLETPLHTSSTRQGDAAHFRTTDEILAGNEIAIPQGSSVRAAVTKVQRPGRLKGRAEIRLRFEELALADGTKIPLHASVVRAGFAHITNSKDGQPRLKGEGGSGGSLATVGKGGLQGAVLGGVFGGKKGAAYGGAIGAGIGLAGVLLQRGPDLDLPRDMMFELKLDRALDVPASVARRSTQLARNDSATRALSTGAPGGPISNEGNPEPVPDFTKDQEPELEQVETTTVATTAGTTPPVPLPPDSSMPPPVFEDPNTNDPDGFKLKIDVQLVMVDAMVRDRRGSPIDNLRKEDFRIFEDGVEQTIQNFSRDELPLAVALVVDRSGSVAPIMSELRRAAYKALSQLKRGDKVALFAFAGEVQRLEDLTTDRQRIADRIASIRAGGGTNIIDALFDAVYYLSAVAPDRRRAVILVSDNAATTKPRTSQNQLIRLATESETVVYSIKTVAEGTPLTMRIPIWLGGNGSVNKVTQETGGEIIDVQSTGSLDAALAAIVSRLKLRYTLGYQPTSPSDNGSFRRIEVRLSDRFGRFDNDYTVDARRGYYVPTEKVAVQRKP